jgi:hypothetical protein
MMAYLDFSNAEDKRIQEQLAADMEQSHSSNQRGTREIWRACERDTREQQQLYGYLL